MTYNVFGGMLNLGTIFTGQMTQPIQCQAVKDNSWSVHQVKGQSHKAKPGGRMRWQHKTNLDRDR